VNECDCASATLLEDIREGGRRPQMAERPSTVGAEQRESRWPPLLLGIEQGQMYDISRDVSSDAVLLP